MNNLPESDVADATAALAVQAGNGGHDALAHFSTQMLAIGASA
jgi:hypothetical protein